MLEPIPGLDRWLDPPAEDLHHEDCPRHRWNNVLDEPDDCECVELIKADKAAAAEERRIDAKGDY